jgi:hypothetical protein
MKKIYQFLTIWLSFFLLAVTVVNSQTDDYKKYIIETIITEDGDTLCRISVPGKPPENYKAPIAYPTDASKTLPSVPAFDWSFGCSATSAAMIAGYYDNMGYPNMYTGPTNGGVMPMNNSSWPDVYINGEWRHQCPLSATRNGVDGRSVRGHVDDYWVSYLSGLPDPYIGNWTQHTYGECTGDYMKTNQSALGNDDGSTNFTYYTNGAALHWNSSSGWQSGDGMYGFKLFAESRGYTVNDAYTQLIDGLGNTYGFTFANYKAQIDAGRPVLIHISGHTMTGYGYNDAGSIIYLHDTWDYSNHSMTWGGSYGGSSQWGVTVLELAPSTINVWTGATGHYWGTHSNWSLGHFPTATEDVEIPNVNMPCIVDYSDKTCRDLNIYSGATVKIYDQALTVNGDMDISGAVEMLDDDAVLTVFGYTYWHSGSTANITASGAKINAYGDWRFYSGSNATLNTGFVDFKGTSSCWIRSYTTNSSFNNFRVYKSGGAKARISNACTSSLIINGLTFISSGCILESWSDYDIIMRGNFNYYGTFDFTQNSNIGSVIFDGATQSVNNYNSGSGVFNDVVFSSSTGTTLYNNDMTVMGSLTIEQGYFNPDGNTVSVGGNWTNSVGPAGFIEGTGRVIFDGGNYHQYCYTNETFNELEINKSAGGAFRMDGTNVVCAAYDWTAGAVDVLSGSFTANDLLDNAIKGAFYNNAGGTINLTNSGSGTLVDLSGELHLYGGTMNVTGSISWWPYGHDASMEMTAGVLDFTSCGITIYNTSTYTLTEDITGGTIRTAGGFSGQRADFTPSAGTFEFYGGTDANFSQTNGCTLYNVNIDKLVKEGTKNTKIITAAGDRTDKTFGDGKGNTLTLLTDIAITNNLDIASGTLTIGSHTLTIDGYCNINGLMDVGATGIVQNHGLFELGSAGTLNITGGSFINDHPYGSEAWQYMQGTFNLSAGLFEIMHNSILLESTFIDNITGGTIRTGHTFQADYAGTFEPSGGAFEFTGTGGTPFIDCGAGNYFNDLDINSSSDYVLHSNIEVNGNLTIDNGLLDFHSYIGDFDLSCLGNVIINSGGSMSVGENSTLKLDDGSNLVVAAGGEIQIVGTDGNEASVTNISTGAYSFSVWGTIGAEYAIFEYMDANGINVKTGGLVDPSYTFSHCIFRNGTPAKGSAYLVLNSSNTFTATGTYFENTSGVGNNVWKYYDTGHATFTDAFGDFAGPEFEFDPNSRIDWGPFDVTMDLTVMLEGAYNGTNMNTDLINLGLIPLSQPFNSNPAADWYYTGSESVGSIPANVVDWVLVQIRSASDAASADGGTVVAEQAAFLLNDGSIVDLDGSSNLFFSGITYSSGLFPVVWHRNHLGVISANKMTRTGGVYTYNFTQAGSAYSDTNAGEGDLGGGIFGMFGGDSNGSGWVYDGDTYYDWNPYAGETGYRKADYNLDGQLDNKDKNDVWFDSYNMKSQIPGSKGNFSKDNK